MLLLLSDVKTLWDEARDDKISQKPSSSDEFTISLPYYICCEGEVNHI